MPMWQRSNRSPESLGRVLNVMADIGVLERDPSGKFANSEISDLLREDMEGSLRNYVLFRTDGSRLAPWMELPSVLKSGQPAFESVHGTTSTDYRKQHPEFGVVFNKMMREVYQGDGERIARGFDFGRFASILDVGGGLGHVLAQVLTAHAAISGGLYDLPLVADGAEAFLTGQDLADRCQIIKGSFFDAVPNGYEAYFLKSVIHDFNDERAIQILTNCRNVINEEGRILVAEQIIDSSDDLYPDRYTDLEMVVQTGGKERTRKDFEELFSASGLTLVDCHRIEGSSFSIVEGKPL